MAENSKEISKQEEHNDSDPLHRERESSALKDEEKLQSFWYHLADWRTDDACQQLQLQEGRGIRILRCWYM